MSDFRPIETRYKGYRFRSRLEARWAVFFDAMGTQWKYEDEGFHLPNGEQYLPDFWLPQIEVFAEIKGKDFTAQEAERCRLLAIHTGHTVIMLDEAPDLRMYPVFFGTTGQLEHQAFESKEYRVDSAVEAARSARFEHGEAGLPVMPVPLVPSRQRTAIGTAEREIIRALLHDRSRLAVIGERLGLEAFETASYRAIYAALLEAPEDAPLSAILPAEFVPLAEELASGERVESQSVDDALALFRVREFEQRLVEIESRFPEASDDERDTLSAQKLQIIRDMRTLGRHQFKAFRRRPRS